VSTATVCLDPAGWSSPAELQAALEGIEPATSVNVVVPAWLGVGDRHHAANRLDPDGVRPLNFVSSTLAGVYGHHLGRTDESSTHAVLCLDLRIGWSAGLVLVEPSGLTEVASWGASPEAGAGRIDDETSSTWLVDHVLAAASTVPGAPAISGVLVMDDDGATSTRVRRTFIDRDEAPPGRPVFSKRARTLIAKGVASMRGGDAVARSVGSLAHALAVQADDDPQQPAMRVVAAEHAIFPSSTRLTFDLGPDDGSPLHFDLFELDRSEAGLDAVKGRAVLRSHLVRERGYDRSMVVTFQLGSNGRFDIGPAKAWRLEWEPPSVDIDELF
jgi:hypothetical protein